MERRAHAAVAAVNVPPERDARTLEAMKLLKEWITWLVTIETAAIGGLLVGLKDVTFEGSCRVAVPFYREVQCDLAARILASGGFIAFGLAIMVAMYLLLALPALADRMQQVGDDFYFMRAVGRGLKWPIYRYVRGVRWSSVLGFLLLAMLLLLVIWTRGHLPPIPT
jgi:hypothetical protein